MERKGKVNKKQKVYPAETEGREVVQYPVGYKDPEGETGPEVIEFAGKEVRVTQKEETAFNKELEAEEAEKEKLPIDKLIDIAVKNKLIVEDSPEARWNHFIAGIKLHELIYDCMQSSMNEFCKKYNAINPKDNLKLKLHLRKEMKKGTIFGVKLVLECRKENNYFIMLEQYVGFQHVKQVRDETSWKYTLYGEMFNTLMSHSLTFLLMQHDVNTGRIKPEVSEGPTT